MSGLYSDFKGWITKPLTTPNSLGDLVLLLVFAATVTLIWSRILNRILEDA
jgi:hypothetical protein